MTIWVLRANGAVFVSDSFRHSMRTIASLVIPDEDERQEAKRMDRFPELSAVGAQGTFYQYVRQLGQVRFGEEFSLGEHCLKARPGFPTQLVQADLAVDPDPSYEVQSALWGLATDVDRSSHNAAAKSLEDTIRRKIEEKATRSSAEEILATMTVFEDRFQGIRVVPRFGRPKDVLEAIPSEAARVFRTAARMAFARQ